MSISITRCWHFFCQSIMQSLRRSKGRGNATPVEKLEELLDSAPPKSGDELEEKLSDGNALLRELTSQDSESQKAYMESSHHEEIAIPVESIADQAEQARSEP